MHKYQRHVKEFLVKYVVELRQERGLTKTSMSVLLRMDPRSYSPIEAGEYGLSAAALMSLLIALEDSQTLELVHAFQSYVLLIKHTVAV